MSLPLSHLARALRRSLLVLLVVLLAAVPAVTTAGPADASAPRPAAQSVGAPGSFRIAYSDPHAAVKEATQHRVFVLNPDAFDFARQIKARNPDAVVLMYKNLQFTSDHYWNYHASSGTDRPYLTVGVGFAQTQANDWFLLDSKDRRINNAWGLWLVDFGDPGYQKAWFDNVHTELVAGKHWDGVFFDDVNWRADSAGKIPAKYPTNSTFRAAATAAVKQTSQKLRERGYLTILNIGASHVRPQTWDEWLPFADGAMEEHFTNWNQTPGGPFIWDWGTDGWAAHIQQAQTATRMGKLTLLRVGGANGDRDAIRYGLASYLLVNDGRQTISPPEMTATPTYPEFSYDLGAPRGAYQHLGNSVYRRTFERGTVIVNASENRTATIPLPTPHLDHHGNTITSITLTGTRGAILRHANTTSTKAATPEPTPAAATTPRAPTVALSPTPTTAPAPGGALLAADVTGTGNEDLLSYDPGNGAWRMASRGADGTFSAPEQVVSYATTRGWAAHLAADITGNRRGDLLSYHPGNGTWWVSKARNDGTVAGPQRLASYVTKDGWQAHLAADVTGNGRAEVLSYHPGNGSWWRTSARTDGSLATPRRVATYGTRTGWGTHLAADFTGDGRADLLSYRPSTGAWWLSPARSDGTFAAPRHVTTYGTRTGWETHLTADLTGNGRADLLSYHPGNGTWWLSSPRSDGTLSSPRLLTTYGLRSGWGAHVAADLTGDGRASLLSYHASSGAWWITDSR
jgi:hypothetical protein